MSNAGVLSDTCAVGIVEPGNVANETSEWAVYAEDSVGKLVIAGVVFQTRQSAQLLARMLYESKAVSHSWIVCRVTTAYLNGSWGESVNE